MGRRRKLSTLWLTCIARTSPGKYEAKTDRNGKFVLHLPFAGSYVIAVSMPNAQPQFRSNVKAGRDTDFDFLLSPGDGRRFTSLEDIEASVRRAQEDAEAQARSQARQQEQEARQKAQLQEQYDAQFDYALSHREELVKSMSPQAITTARSALKSLRKIAGALEIGVKHEEYSSRLIDIKADVDEATASMPDNAIKTELNLALTAYVDAAKAWNEMTQHDFMLVKFELGASLQKKYSIPVDTHLGDGMMHREVVLNTIWRTARTHIERASLLINQ